MTTRTAGADEQTPSWTAGSNEWDRLTAALNRWGVIHVAPGAPVDVVLPGTAADLMSALFRCSEPRLHQAAVMLLLTHPHLATDARIAIAPLVGTQRDRAQRRYVAAAALQRMARTRIALRFGPQPLIPPAYLDELRVPTLETAFGRATLLALSAEEERRYGYDAWETYRNLLDLFLNEIERRAWGNVCEQPPTARS